MRSGAPIFGAHEAMTGVSSQFGGNMSESSLPAAGWYPAAHAEGRMQYWDGAAWVAPSETASEGEVGRPSFMKRPVTRRTGAIVAGATLIAGLFFGATTAGAGSASEVDSLTSRIAVLEAEVDEAQTSVAESDSAAAAWEDKHDDVRAELADMGSQMGEMQTAAEAAQVELEARAATIAELQGQVAARVAPAPVVETAPAPAVPAPAVPAPPASISYENCTAVRNAGAAPIRAGDPGYGTHLDRDRDGIGCE